MSRCPRVSGSARSSSSIGLPSGLLIKSPALYQPLAQTLWPYIGPALFDVAQTRSAVRFAINRASAGSNVGEGRPQAALLLVVNQHERAAIRREWNTLRNATGGQRRRGIDFAT